MKEFGSAEPVLSDVNSVSDQNKNNVQTLVAQKEEKGKEKEKKVSLVNHN